MDDQIINAIPPKYLGLAVAVLALLRALDGIIRLIPDRWLSAHTTTEAIVLGLRRGGAWLFTRKAPPAALLFFLLFLPSCGHAAQAARGTFATLAAAEHSYAKWATAEVDRLVAQAKADCPNEPGRAACVERLTGPTFRNLEITDAAPRDRRRARRR